MSQPRRILDGSHKHRRSPAFDVEGTVFGFSLGADPAGGWRAAFGPKEVVAGGWARRGGVWSGVFRGLDASAFG